MAHLGRYFLAAGLAIAGISASDAAIAQAAADGHAERGNAYGVIGQPDHYPQHRYRAQPDYQAQYYPQQRYQPQYRQPYYPQYQQQQYVSPKILRKQAELAERVRRKYGYVPPQQQYYYHPPQQYYYQQPAYRW